MSMRCHIKALAGLSRLSGSFRMRGSTAAVIAMIILGVTAQGAGAAYQMPVTFGGYTNRPEILTNFPVLVVLSNNVGGSGFSFANQPFSSINGWDLRFRDGADTTNLNYEIESWNTGGTCYVWVQVPAIPGNGTGSILARWGSAAVQQPCTTNGSVWASSYRGVWHMANATGVSASDSTRNNHTGSLNGPSWTNGPLGSALSFDGVNDTVTLGSELWDADTQGSVSAWVCPRASGGALLVATTVGVDNKEIRFEQTGSMQTWLNPTFNDAASVSPALTTNQWYYLTYTIEGGKWIIYVNGVSNALSFAAGGNNGRWFNSIATSGTQTYQMGDLNATYHDWMNGITDELRVESVGHSSNWVWATYQNMASNTSFSSYGAVSADPVPYVDGGSGVTGLTPDSVWLTGVLVSTGASPTAWGILWGTNNPGAVLTNWLGGSTNLETPVSLPLTNSTQLTGLTSETTYWYAFWATNAGGTNITTPASFTTPFSSVEYPGRMKISFTNYTRGEMLTNFPALVVFSNNMASGGFTYSGVQSTNGWDLRFLDGSGTVRLNHEIENWNTNGLSHVWVQVPLLTNGTVIWAHWGRSSSAAAPAVFTTNGATWSNNYLLVWHMQEGDVTRESVAGYSTTKSGAAAATNSGRLAGGLSLGGVESDHMDSAAYTLTGAYGTFEAWAYPDSLPAGNYHRIMETDYRTNVFLGRYGSTNSWAFLYNDSAVAQPVAGGTLTDKQWSHVAGAYGTDGKARLYVGGVEVGTPVTRTATPVPYTHTVCMGKNPNATTDTSRWKGILDEVRVSSVARSSNWIWACYQNMASNSVFNTCEKASSSAPPSITSTEANPNPSGSTNTQLSVTATDADGESVLRYYWSTTGSSAGDVVFSTNGNNAAKLVTALFTNAGVCDFRVVVSNLSMTATGTVSVTVTQTLTSLQLGPNAGGTNDVTLGQTLQFTTLLQDQFGHSMGAASTNWAVLGDTGYFDADGLFTATNGGTAFVTATCGGFSATSAVRVVSGATYSISVSSGANGAISPAGPSVSVVEGEDRTFSIIPATGYHIHDVQTNGIPVGAVSSFTFSNVTANGLTIRASFTNFAPQVAIAAAATPQTVSSTSTVLSVLGSDYEGEPDLTYTWSTGGTPPGVVAFSANNNNAAKTTTAVFTNAGAYGFQVVIRDLAGLTVTSLVNVTVSQTPAVVTVSPASASIGTGMSNQFSAATMDQFNHVIVSPVYTWTVNGGGTVDSSGWFTAGVTPGGPYTLTASNGMAAGTATLSVTGPLIWDGTTNNWETQHWRDQTNGLNTPVANLSYTATSGVVQVSSAIFPAALSIEGAGRLAVTATGSGIGPITLAGGTVEHNSGSAFTLTSSNGYTLASGTTSTVNVVYYNGENTFSLTGLIGGGGSLMKVGPGTLYLGGSNAFTGGFIMTTGYLSVANSDAFGVTGSTRGPLTWIGGKINFANSGLNIGNPLRIGGGFASQLIAACGGQVTFSGDVTLINDVWFQPNVYDTKAALSGNISGGYGLSTSDRITRLSGSNTYTGVTTVESGTLQLYASSGGNAVPGNLTVNAGNVVLFASDRIADPATVTLAGTACLALCDPGIPGSTQYETIGALEGSGGYVTVVNGGSDVNPNNKCTLTISKTAGISTYGGVLADSVSPNARIHTLSLIKSGVGTQVLAGASTYSGATTVSNGVLLVNGSLSAASSGIVVCAGGTLGGTGTISRVVSNLAGSAISPGDGINTGVLTVSNLFMSADSTAEFDLAAVNASDSVAVRGDLTLDGTLVVRAASGFRAGTYTLMTYTGTLSGSIKALQTPRGRRCIIDTATPGQVKLVVTSAGTAICIF